MATPTAPNPSVGLKCVFPHQKYSHFPPLTPVVAKTIPGALLGFSPCVTGRAMADYHGQPGQQDFPF